MTKKKNKGQISFLIGLGLYIVTEIELFPNILLKFGIMDSKVIAKSVLVFVYMSIIGIIYLSIKIKNKLLTKGGQLI